MDARTCEIMDISDTNTILTELQLEQLEEHEDGQVYYTVLEDDDENFTVKPESEEFINTDNVFYLSLNNEEERETEITETQDDQENVENYEETSTNMELIEEIVLPDGTQAYLKRNVEQGEELYEEQDIDSFDLIDNTAVLTSEIKKEINFESDEEEEEVTMKPVQDFDNNLLITQDNEEEFDESKYQQVQLEDNSVALIEIGLYNSIVEQSKKRGQSSKENVKSFQCPNDDCNKLYSTMHHLRVHMRNHTGTRPYKCKVDGCEKAFATGYSLKAHSRTHTGEKPYGCRTCLKSFKASGDLQKHIRIHTGEKPFMCPIDGCGRSFTTSNIRKVHIRSHTGERPYSCSEPGCLKAFASATNYKNHMRIHSGEKPYACSVEGCGKRFTEYSSLYKHQMVHANSKSVKCEYCNRILRHPSTLIAHKRTAHNIIRTETGAEIMVQMVKSSDEIPTYLTEVNADAQGQSQILFVSP